MAGVTADYIKVTWKNGKIVGVETWDANESTRAVDAESVDAIRKTINRKLDVNGTKPQSQKVAFVAHNMEQAQAVADKFVGNANVRVIFAGDGKPGSTMFDTHMSGGLRGGSVSGSPRSGGGGKSGGGKRGGGLGGKVMNGAGILGDLTFIWEGWKTLERGCDDVVVSCGPRPPPDRRGRPRWAARHTTRTEHGLHHRSEHHGQTAHHRLSAARRPRRVEAGDRAGHGSLLVRP
ncbi:hypothetical protein [Streptomyces sp. NPDC005486]|uniref:hypothetical protein n=1 Tax=Streptomyces sp. NPDC005486 TaxID=3155345 RepID=UPI0033B51FB4